MESMDFTLSLLAGGTLGAVFKPFLVAIGLGTGIASETLRSLVWYLAMFGGLVILTTAIVPSLLPPMCARLVMFTEYFPYYLVGSAWALIGYAMRVGHVKFNMLRRAERIDE